MGRPRDRSVDCERLQAGLERRPDVSANNWLSVKKDRPCPICKKPDFCSISADGGVIACRRVESGAFKSKTDKAGVPFYLHRRDGSSPPPDTAPPFAAGESSRDRADLDTLHAV